MRVVFCGEAFPAARQLLQERLPGAQLVVCPDRGALEQMHGVDVLIPLMFRIDAPLMRRMRPRLVHQWGSGLDGVDLEAARALGIPVASVPASGSNADSVAEHVLLLILSVLRELPQAQANVRAGRLGAPMGRMLAGRTVCLWGLGATALAVARRLRGFEVRVLGITRDPAAPKVSSFGLDRCCSPEQRAECLRETDVLVLCVRLSDATRGLVDAGALALLPARAILVNAARGALIDYEALYAALAAGRLAGAGLDVYWEEPIAVSDPLLSLPNVITTPHVAGVTDSSYAEIAAAVAANVERLNRGEPLLNRAP